MKRGSGPLFRGASAKPGTRPSFFLYGGKGGVGKTTCAAARAVWRAEQGARVLVLSIDPAHSLGDAFGKPLTAKPSRIATRRGSLMAAELDAAAAVDAWLKTRRPALARLIEQGTLLDNQDVARLLKLPVPGLDELAAFLAITSVEGTGEYEEIVVDTAPTGHTLRLLDVPRVVTAVADLLDAMHGRHVMVARALGGSVGADELVEELRRDALDVEQRLHDPTRCAIAWVTLPELLAVQETIDGIGWLRRGGFPIEGLVVNRHTPRRSSGCAECRARAEAATEALTALAVKGQRLRLSVVEDVGEEPRGVRALRDIGAALNATRSWSIYVSPRGKRSAPSTVRPARPARPDTTPRILDVPAPVRLVFFGGKGGVGKTTCAAATALALARATPKRRIRLISTDPAPSLGDVLGMQVGDDWQSVPGRWHLQVRELNAAAVFDAYRRRYQEAVGEFFDRLAGGSPIDATADRAVFERLFDLAPPGIDELTAILTVMDLMKESGDDIVVVDTAPTGHTVRLLKMQGDVQQWVAVLMQLVIKYRLAARAESLARDLVQLSRGIREFRALLTDRARSRFVAVVRPAALPRLETERLFASLDDLNVPAPALIVNGETKGTCTACLRRARSEAQELTRLRKLCGSGTRRCDIMHAPIRFPPPRGVQELLDWRDTWRPDALPSRAGDTGIAP